MLNYIKKEPARSLAILATVLTLVQGILLPTLGNSSWGDVGTAITAILAVLAEFGIRPLVTPLSQPRDNNGNPLHGPMAADSVPPFKSGEVQ